MEGANIAELRKNLEDSLQARYQQQIEDDIPEAEPIPDFILDAADAPKKKKKKKSKKNKKKSLKAEEHHEEHRSADLILDSPKNHANNPPEPASEQSRKEKTDLSLPKSKSKKNTVQYQEAGSQLHYHAGTGNWEVIESLLNDYPNSIDCRSGDGRNIFHVSCTLGHNTVVKNLILRKVDLNPQMENGITPLMLAAATGQFETVKILLEAGADIMITSHKDSYTALHLGTVHQQIDIVRAILEHVTKLIAEHVSIVRYIFACGIPRKISTSFRKLCNNAFFLFKFHRKKMKNLNNSSTNLRTKAILRYI